MAFQYTEAESKRLQKAITNYNNKVNRLMKANHPYLPPKASSKEVKQKITNRWGYNRELKYLEKFTTRGSENLVTTEGGATLTKYEYEMLQNEQRRLYAKLTYRIDKYGNTKPTIAGVEQDETYARMGDEMYENLKARRRKLISLKLHDINKKDLRILKDLVARTKEQYDRGDEKFFERFIDMMFGSQRYYKLDDRVTYIIDKLKTLRPNEFMNMYFTEQLFREIVRAYNDKSKTPYAEGKQEMETMIDMIYTNIDTMVADYD